MSKRGSEKSHKETMMLTDEEMLEQLKRHREELVARLEQINLVIKAFDEDSKEPQSRRR